MDFQPTATSLTAHQIPDWFHDAKFGIFIHWGLYSVPAWAPKSDDIQALMKEGGMSALMGNNPYAEWYMNSMKIPSHPTYAYHRKTYGEHSSYFDFQAAFEEASAKMDPDEWADLFARAGARYVVMVTKHHDGYTLWPTKHPNPVRENYFSKRDLVGEVTDAVRKRAMKMGHYYSGVLDWSFKHGPITDFHGFLENQQQAMRYVEYATAHWHEIVERYETSVLWNDIGYPHGYDVNQLFARYYNTIADGVINDRWNQTKLPSGPVGKLLVKMAIRKISRKIKKGHFELAPKSHYDYRTPEYAVYPDIREEKWESCRGIGHSFGINHIETEADMLGGDELIWMLSDTVSKNGNLLLNVGPAADGTIPAMQQRPLLELGRWLSAHGEAIYGTRPWKRAEGTLSDGTQVRYTSKDGTVYAVIQSAPEGNRIEIQDFQAGGDAVPRLLGTPGEVTAIGSGANTVVTLPGPAKTGETIVVAFKGRNLA